MGLSVHFFLKTENGILTVGHMGLFGLSVQFSIKPENGIPRPYGIARRVTVTVRFVLKPENGTPRPWDCSSG